VEGMSIMLETITKVERRRKGSMGER
jgi:hypothetical protein